MKRQGKTVLLLMLALTIISCRKKDFQGPSAKVYPSDVAVAWMKLQMNLNKTTPGFNSIVGDRSFGYAGLVLYESVEPGITNYQSVALQLSGFSSAALPAVKKASYFWPASANAAMALITRDLFANTSAANLATVDSLEAAFTQQFHAQATAQELENSVDFGHAIASAIFDWSKTDGGDQAYIHLIDPNYTLPAGPGLWVPTPPLFTPAVLPHWGNNRTFMPNAASTTQPGAPIAYSEDPKSPFYQMVNELYTASLSLTHEDSIIAKFWADIPGNFNVPAHATSILTQLIVLNKSDLGEAAIAYAKHGIALNDAAISVFYTKYNYNLLRPISYIRNVMEFSTWNTVVPTPVFPEYTAAHAVISGASAAVLEGIFGNQYSFTDHTYDAVFGARSFNSFDDYAKEAGRSRFLAGIHYNPSIATGLIQGRKIGVMVNGLHFKQ